MPGSVRLLPPKPGHFAAGPMTSVIVMAYSSQNVYGVQLLSPLCLCIFTRGPQSQLGDLCIVLVSFPPILLRGAYTWNFHRSHHLVPFRGFLRPTNNSPFSVHPGNSLHTLVQAYRRQLLLLTILSASQGSSTRSMSPIASASSPMLTYYPFWRRLLGKSHRSGW